MYMIQEDELSELEDRLKDHERDQKLLNERNQQIHSLERDLAHKEDTIHKILAEKEEAQMLASQVCECARLSPIG